MFYGYKLHVLWLKGTCTMAKRRLYYGYKAHVLWLQGTLYCDYKALVLPLQGACTDTTRCLYWHYKRHCTGALLTKLVGGCIVYDWF